MSALLIPVGSAGDLHPYIGLALAERLKGVDGLAAAYEVIEFAGSSRRPFQRPTSSRLVSSGDGDGVAGRMGTRVPPPRRR